MFIKDLEQTSYAPDCHEGERTVSIGWLGNEVPTSGAVPAEFISVLRHLYNRRSYSEGELGYHGCEICNNYISHGEISLSISGTKYIMPLMILHYIEDHHYAPPEEFVKLTLDFWRSENAAECRDNVCRQRPDNFCPGFYRKTYDSRIKT